MLRAFFTVKIKKGVCFEVIWQKLGLILTECLVMSPHTFVSSLSILKNFFMTKSNQEKLNRTDELSIEQIRNNGVCLIDQADQNMSTRTINVVKIYQRIH